MRSFVEWNGIPFLCVPNDKPVASHNIDLIVLARYMQILSPELGRALTGRCINIHHSFLPSFKGAGPRQVFAFRDTGMRS